MTKGSFKIKSNLLCWNHNWCNNYLWIRLKFSNNKNKWSSFLFFKRNKL